MRGTGTPVWPSAVMTRYSRSTACADGSSLPGGLRRRTYSRPPRRQVVRRVRLAAAELADLERAAEARDALAQVALQRGDVEPVLLANLGGLRDHPFPLTIDTRWPSYCIP